MAKLLEEEKMFEQNFFENQKTFMEDIDTETTLPQPYMKFNQRRDTAKYVTDMKSTAEKMEKPIIQVICDSSIMQFWYNVIHVTCHSCIM